MLALLAAAVWPSAASLVALGSGDTPLSFVPLVPLLGAGLIVWRFDRTELEDAPHDGFLDGLVVVALLVTAVIVFLVLPVIMSWDYWLARLDILGVLVALTALLVVGWGLPALSRLWPGLLYFLLTWPLPYLLLDNHILPGLTAVTARAARALVVYLPFHIRPDSADAYALLVPHAGHVTALVIAQACSGVNGTLGLAVVALPVAVVAKGDRELRLVWVVLGACLSWMMNLVRILIIAVAAATLGPESTLTFLHPVFGLALFALSFGLLLAIAPLMGVNLSPLYAARVKKLSPRPVGWGPARVVVLGTILVGVALVESNLKQFTWVSQSSLPQAAASSRQAPFLAPRGWKASSPGSVPAWKALFGNNSTSAVLHLTGPGQHEVLVQAIMTSDLSAFNSYGVENCYVFHGYALRQVSRVPLGDGITATQVDFQTPKSKMATLYWLQDVRTPVGIQHERIVFIADARSTVAPAEMPVAAPPSNPVEWAAEGLAQLFSPWVGGRAGPEYNAVNLELQRLGRQAIARERVASN